MFLAEVARRTSGRHRGIDFAAILDDLVTWSGEGNRGLVARAPGKQQTVSFGDPRSEAVLWSAYPRHGDGAKVVVLPKTFRRLTTGDQDKLVRQLGDVSPNVRVVGTGLLQLPMHVLAPSRALKSFYELLDVALSAVRSRSPGDA